MKKHSWVGPPTGLMDAECERCGVPYDSDDCDKPCEAPEFVREVRYAVYKLSDLERLSQKDFDRVVRLLDKAGHILDEAGLPMRNCVVVEDDWPEYEPTWRAIEARWHRERLAKADKQ